MRLFAPGSLIQRSREYASLGRKFSVEQGAHGQQVCQRSLVDMNLERVFSFAFGHAFASTQILGAEDGIGIGIIGHPLPAPDDFESDRVAAQVTARADDQRQFTAFGDESSFIATRWASSTSRRMSASTPMAEVMAEPAAESCVPRRPLRAIA